MNSTSSAAMLRQAFQRLAIAPAAMKPATTTSSSFSPFSPFSAFSASSSSSRTFSTAMAPSIRPALSQASPLSLQSQSRAFSATAAQGGSWLEPALDRRRSVMKGRPRVATGGSTKGTTVVWGDYGLQMYDHHRRISAKQLKVAEDTIKMRLRGERYRLYKRVNCNIGVFVAGNEIRMGKGKGSFDHWAARCSVNKVLFELRGALHEQVARDAFRLAGNKLPGQYKFVKRGEAPVVGITRLDGVTLEELKRPRRAVPAPAAAPAAPAATETAAETAPPS
ncbi:ribosomal protein l16p l10e [Ophiostoma piceae UAMH 11346]|uniref:Ribosomal protein l16p l10e n=1 Tax=Ophiostoma piceae (strain UAMH 11346) TaxID=1262450 RepID=S3C3Q4_OPHP1|nr:ribosomal protein l16p l10e [Ophiostoma piceae UAMH 11346]